MTNLVSINSMRLEHFPVLIPSTMEQKVIIKLRDYFLKKVASLRSCKSSPWLDEKTILARAFRGELGKNDSKEEIAVKLLKRSAE